MESRDIPVLIYTYVVDGQTYDDDMGRDPAALPRFYGFLKEVPESEMGERSWRERVVSCFC